MKPNQVTLSRRERQVLLAMLHGLAEKQIAVLLSLTTHTVHSYVKAVYRRFGVSSRSELMALWIDQTLACITLGVMLDQGKIERMLATPQPAATADWPPPQPATRKRPRVASFAV
jgi:DNA-binding CsgD family transcriptional regulator